MGARQNAARGLQPEDSIYFRNWHGITIKTFLFGAVTSKFVMKNKCW